ncbi:MAG: aryl-sulfate sulfotransferase [Candidatus Hodarchaeota archaeon]
MEEATFLSPKNSKRFLLILINFGLAILILTMPVSAIYSTINSGINYPENYFKTRVENSDVLSDFKRSIDITHHYSMAQDGFNLFQGRLSNESGSCGNYLFILDMKGDIKYAVKSNDRFKTPKFINSTTITYMMAGDIQLRNLETNVTEILPIPEGHHDLEYNPFTDTFLTLQNRKKGTYQGLPIWYDDIVEYDRQGNQLWVWNCSKHLPFNTDHFLNELWRGGQDWTHANSIFWLVEEDIIYYNPRNLDTFYKINKQTGEIIWAVGKLGDFTLYDKYGREQTTLWWHSHALEMIGPNLFILFDNDHLNQTNPLNHRSRLLEISVNESTMTAEEVWSWTAPEEYYCEPWGDADRLPNGNTLGAFGASFNKPTHLTEITPNGKIAWEIEFDRLPEIQTQFYQVERFFKAPLINITQILEYQTEEGGRYKVDLSVWNTYRTRYPSRAKISFKHGEEILLNDSFDFLPHWQETKLTYEVPYHYSSKNEIKVVVENSDGVRGISNLSVTIKETQNFESSGFLISFIGIVIGVLALVNRQKRSRNLP